MAEENAPSPPNDSDGDYRNSRSGQYLRSKADVDEYIRSYARHGKLTFWRNPGETFTERIPHFGKWFAGGAFIAFLFTTIPPTRAAKIISFEQSVRFPVRTLLRNCC